MKNINSVTREIIFQLDVEKTIIYVNEGWKNVLGYDLQDSIGKLITDFLSEDEVIYISSDAEAKSCCQKAFIHIDGTRRYLDIVSKALLNDDGRVTGIYGSMIDRTELRELKIRQVQLRDLVENSKDIIYHYQIHPERKFVYLSPSISDVLGYSRERNYSDPLLVFDVIHPDDRHMLEKKDRGEVDFGKPLKCRWRHISGEYIWMEEHLVPIYDDNNKLVAVQGVCRDITEQKLAQQENERLLQSALEYDRLKTEFFSNISHEFRTPLNIILGAIQLLGKIGKSNNSQFCIDNLDKYVKVMKQNCYRLLRLVNNLIDISKSDNGFLEMSPKNYNIVSVIEDITLSVAQYVESKGINLIFDTTIEEKVIACDLDKMERVMLNLLSNAIKFTKPGGHIFVTVGEVEDGVSISVRDTGIGIKEEMLDLIFDRFRQVSPLLTRAHE